MCGVIPSSAVSKRWSISRVKCFASWKKKITIRFSSLVLAAEGLQLNDPVITFLLSTTANLWLRSLRWVSRLGFLAIRPLKSLVGSAGPGGGVRATAGYELEVYPGFCLRAALSQILYEESFLRKAPALRNNNGTLQLRVRIEGKDHFINRLGRWDYSALRAKALSMSAEIWSDLQHGSWIRASIATSLWWRVKNPTCS